MVLGEVLEPKPGYQEAPTGPKVFKNTPYNIQETENPRMSMSRSVMQKLDRRSRNRAPGAQRNEPEDRQQEQLAPYHSTHMRPCSSQCEEPCRSNKLLECDVLCVSCTLGFKLHWSGLQRYLKPDLKLEQCTTNQIYNQLIPGTALMGPPSEIQETLTHLKVKKANIDHGLNPIARNLCLQLSVLCI
jgi:hypothetical protein